MKFAVLEYYQKRANNIATIKISIEEKDIMENIPDMQSDFERIKHQGEDGTDFWSARELCSALGYSSYQKFERLLTKAVEIARQKGLNPDDHFNQTVEMVQLGSGAFRRVENQHLSRMACMIIAQNGDTKKPQVQVAREYFAQQTPTSELMINSLESNVLFYKTGDRATKIQVIFNNETFWMSQKRMAELFGVEVPTINYHLSEIYKSGELTERATIRKIRIVQDEGEREVNRQPLFYNLDAIIAVGYRVNSYQATQFSPRWRTGRSFLSRLCHSTNMNCCRTLELSRQRKHNRKPSGNTINTDLYKTAPSYLTSITCLRRWMR